LYWCYAIVIAVKRRVLGLSPIGSCSTPRSVISAPRSLTLTTRSTGAVWSSVATGWPRCGPAWATLFLPRPEPSGPAEPRRCPAATTRRGR